MHVQSILVGLQIVATSSDVFNLERIQYIRVRVGKFDRFPEHRYVNAQILQTGNLKYGGLRLLVIFNTSLIYPLSGLRICASVRSCLKNSCSKEAEK